MTGLQGDPLTLIERSGATQVLSQDGPFSFTVAGSDGYQITVLRNPRERLCDVQNGFASQIAADVDDVLVECNGLAEAPPCTGTTDSDEDGLTDCQEVELATHPWSDDTDGDGYLDLDEYEAFDPDNDNFVFNPRIADMPTMAIDLTSLPQVELDFEESSGTSRSVATEHGTGSSSSIGKDYGGEISRQVESGHTLNVSTTQTVGAKVSVSPTDFGGEVSYESSLTVGFERSVTQSRGSSVNWNATESRENSRTYSESLDLSETYGVTYTGGKIYVTARVRNDGHIPYDLANLTLSAVLFDSRRPFDIEPVANLQFSDGGFPKTTILSGESAPLNFTADLSLPRAQRVLRESHNLVISPATFLLQDVDESSLLLAEQDIATRTAAIIVDYGIHAGAQDQYRIAVNRGDGTRAISVRDALVDVLGLDIREGTDSWRYGNETQSQATSTGLLKVGLYEHRESTTQYWLVAHNHTNEQGAGERVTDVYDLLREGYDLGEIQLRAGDRLSLVFVIDNDRDGLSNRLEAEIRTDPDLLDTDGDGLEDGEEYYGWLTNLGTPPCDEGDDLRRVRSDPLLADSDDDGTPDDVEKAECGNPGFDFVAEAGLDQVVNRNMLVTLFGGIDGTMPTPAIYEWRLVKGPDVLVDGEPTRELSGRNPSFVAPSEVSSLVFELNATIDEETQTDEVVIQVLEDRLEAVFIGDYAGDSPDGTPERPYRSFDEALGFITPGEDLYVMTQETPYTLVNTLAVPDGTSIYGGYDTDWVRDVENLPTPVTLAAAGDLQPVVSVNYVGSEMWISGLAIWGPEAQSPSDDTVAFLVNAVASRTGTLHINDNLIRAGDVGEGVSGEPGTSYGLIVLALDTLRLRDNEIIAGRGGQGVNGTRGSNGSAGASGGAGGAGGTFWVGASGGSKGDDGPAAGGDGGAAAGRCNHGSSGSPGTSGATGQLGARAGELLPQQALYVVDPAQTGTSGIGAGGGGGGGGGGGCGTANGGRGGDGGRGGTGGGPGGPGASGGASIGLWLFDVLSADIRDNVIEAGVGGPGGASGSGGSGASGLPGAAGSPGQEICVLGLCDRGGSGGRGGNGGSGGTGGRGGSGRGGPSFGVYVAPDLAPVLTGNEVIAATGGPGGNYGHAGSGGHSCAVFDGNIDDEMVPVLSGNDLSFGEAGVAGSPSHGGSAGQPGLAAATNWLIED